MDLVSTQPLAELSTRVIFRGVKRQVRKTENLTTFMCRLSTNSESLNLLELQGKLRACNDIASKCYLYLLANIMITTMQIMKKLDIVNCYVFSLNFTSN